MTRVSVENIKEAIIKGIEDSHRFYCKSTGNFNGEEFSKSPEYLVTCKVAKALAKLDEEHCIFMEHSISELIDLSGAACVGKYAADIRKNGRADIVLYWKKGDPRAVIEVKSPVIGTSEYNKDFYRIAEILKLNKKDHSLQFCAFAFYIERSQDLATAINNIIKCGRVIASEYDLKIDHIEKLHERNSPQWASVCIIFKK